MKARILGLIVFVLCGAAHAEQVVVATWNCEWLFDEDASDDPSNIGPEFAAPDAEEYQSRIKGIAAAIATIKPDILALQEIENDVVVQDLANELSSTHNTPYQVAFVQGKDTHTGQDVAFLVKAGWSITDKKRFSFETHVGDPDFKDLSKHVFIHVSKGGTELRLISIHLITKLNDRLRQARTLRAWTQQLALQGNLIVLGDTNSAVRFNETTPTSDIGIIRGFDTTSTNDDLFDCHQLLDAQSRRTHTGGKELDRILVASNLQSAVTAVATHRNLAVRGSADNDPGVSYELSEAEQDLSDHFPLVATIDLPASPGPGIAGSGATPAAAGRAARSRRDGSDEERLCRLEEQVAELREQIRLLLEQHSTDNR